MSFWQLTPQGTHSSRKIEVHAPWQSPGNSPEVPLLRSWFEGDSGADATRVQGRINWNTLMGLALVLGVSTGFWTGVGLLIARLWK
jgi:hypothetical protein